MSFLIFDIETVADTELWTPPTVEVALPGAAGGVTAEKGPAGEPGAAADGTATPDSAPPKKSRSRAKKADVLPKPTKDVFPPLYAHRPIAIGMMMLADDYAFGGASVVGTLNYGNNEAQLLQGWADYVEALHPTLVSFAGRGFDAPVLAMRAMRHGIVFPWHSRFQNRYHDDHLDLQDRLTEHGAVQRSGMNLSAFSTLIGLPAKTAVDGSKVAELYAAGEHQKIADYCLEDVFRTALLFMRYQLMRGHIGIEKYREVVRGLIENMLSRGPALGGILWGLNQARILAE